MTSNPANGQPPLRVAIFGSGPSGFYAAEELLSQGAPCAVDMFDRLPTPFGLVRGGVAPDHPKIKTVTQVFEKTAARTGFRFFGHVEFGKDLGLDDARRFYDAAIFAIGAKSDRKMGIPGEDLAGGFPATVFVGWYNGHPDYQKLSFDLSCEKAAVIGNGNVAVDVARILARDPKSLEGTDIASYALDALRASKIKEIYMIGRRGPAQAAFTNPELRELCRLEGADLVVEPGEVELDELSRQDLAADVGGAKAKSNVQILKEQSSLPLKGRPRRLVLKFLLSPVEVLGADGKVSALKLEQNRLVRDKDGSLKAVGTGRFETLQAGLLFRSIGYKGVPLAGLPYNEKTGVIPNSMGRVTEPDGGRRVDGLYVVGWAKRGPTGVIGTNKPDSIETVKLLLEDFRNGSLPRPAAQSEEAVPQFLAQRNVHFVTFQEWKKLDAIEIEIGRPSGKVREKFYDVSDMLARLKSL